MGIAYQREFVLLNGLLLNLPHPHKLKSVSFRDHMRDSLYKQPFPMSLVSDKVSAFGVKVVVGCDGELMQNLRNWKRLKKSKRGDLCLIRLRVILCLSRRKADQWMKSGSVDDLCRVRSTRSVWKG